MEPPIYQRLIVWQKAMDLVVRSYKLSDSFRHSDSALANQIRSAATSIPSNVAEGRGRSTKRDFRRFLVQARGSLYEWQTQILVAWQVGYVSESAKDALVDDSMHVLRLLNGLIGRLDRDLRSTPYSLRPKP